MFVTPGLEEQGGLVHEQFDSRLGGPFRRGRERLEDVRVDDGVEALDPLGVAKDLLRQVGPVKRPIVRVGLVAECLDDRGPHGAVLLHESLRLNVGVEDAGAFLLQKAADGRFAAPDAARHAQRNHECGVWSLEWGIPSVEQGGSGRDVRNQGAVCLFDASRFLRFFAFLMSELRARTKRFAVAIFRF